MNTIILAEDDSILRDNLKSFLIHEGFNVLDAENGQAAYNLAVDNHPDIVISDVNMPVSGGKDLMKKLCANPATAKVPFIFMTAEPGLQDELMKTCCSARGCLVKPFNLSDMLNLVEKILVIRINKKIFGLQ